MDVNKAQFNRFSKWFNQNEKKLINLFCKMIRKEKVYDVDFAHFVEYVYNTDKSCKDYNKGRIFKNEKKDK
tara:strand:+ start:392 stop:604 length:213 start_codon:yes stop_codon:yes gene_type:complete